MPPTTRTDTAGSGSAWPAHTTDTSRQSALNGQNGTSKIPTSVPGLAGHWKFSWRHFDPNNHLETDKSSSIFERQKCSLEDKTVDEKLDTTNLHECRQSQFSTLSTLNAQIYLARMFLATSIFTHTRQRRLHQELQRKPKNITLGRTQYWHIDPSRMSLHKATSKKSYLCGVCSHHSKDSKSRNLHRHNTHKKHDSFLEGARHRFLFLWAPEKLEGKTFVHSWHYYWTDTNVLMKRKPGALQWPPHKIYTFIHNARVHVSHPGPWLSYQTQRVIYCKIRHRQFSKGSISKRKTTGFHDQIDSPLSAHNVENTGAAILESCCWKCCCVLWRVFFLHTCTFAEDRNALLHTECVVSQFMYTCRSMITSHALLNTRFYLIDPDIHTLIPHYTVTTACKQSISFELNLPVVRE